MRIFEIFEKTIGKLAGMYYPVTNLVLYELANSSSLFSRQKCFYLPILFILWELNKYLKKILFYFMSEYYGSSHGMGVYI